MKRKKSIHDALDRLEKVETDFLRRQFLAPVIRDGGVRVQIDGVKMQMSISPRNFHGWGIFQPTSIKSAKLIDEATRAQRIEYLKLFPIVRLVACRQDRSEWQTVAAAMSDSRFNLEGVIPMQLTDGVEPFDTVVAQFDGGVFWFESIDPRSDPIAATYLRQSLTAMLEPNKLTRRGLTAEQRIAYALMYRQRIEQLIAEKRASNEGRLRESLEHAGAVLREFVEHKDGFRVTYEIDGRRHMSNIARDLTVQSAGICLSGQDRNFDLASLVGVMREGYGLRRR